MMRRRYYRILWFFAGVILHFIWWEMLRPKIGLRRGSQETRSARFQQIAHRFRLLAIQMGGVMIKVGQFLSARLDVLPREVTDELAGLQDEVRAEAFEDIRRVVESEINAPLEERFAEFQPVALASASIGQVHYARLPAQDGSDEPGPLVVVKVQRPNIEALVATDLAALQVVGRWLNAYPVVRKRANVSALLAEFSRSLYEELDYLNEGKNAETFAANFRNRPEVRVPQVHWSHTTRRMLTLENVLAVKITDYEAMEAAGIDRREVANRLFDTYLKQIFEDRFFHADPHPGNLFVLPVGSPDDVGKQKWQLVFVDFGMTGSISPTLLEALRELFIAVGTRDAARVIRAYQMMGMLLPGADVELLEKAGTKVFERFWGVSTTELVKIDREEVMQFVKEFEALLYDLPFQIPENLILLGRSLSILVGLCTGLDPQFNLWTTVEPYAEKLMASESGGNWRIILKEITTNLLALVTLPRKAESVLNRMEQGRLEVRIPQVTEQLHRIERGQRRVVWAILFTGLFLGGVQMALAGQWMIAGIIWGIGLIFLLFALI